MARRRHTEEQIIGVLQEAEAGTKVAELCRKYGISEATYYNWKTKYAGMTVSELRRLKTLEAENRRLKQIVAEQTLDMQTLKELLAKTSDARGEEGSGGVCGGMSRAEHTQGVRVGGSVAAGVLLHAAPGQGCICTRAAAATGAGAPTFRQPAAAPDAEERRPGGEPQADGATVP